MLHRAGQGGDLPGRQVLYSEDGWYGMVWLCSSERVIAGTGRGGRAGQASSLPLPHSYSYFIILEEVIHSIFMVAIFIVFYIDNLEVINYYRVLSIDIYIYIHNKPSVGSQPSYMYI